MSTYPSWPADHCFDRIYQGHDTSFHVLDNTSSSFHIINRSNEIDHDIFVVPEVVSSIMVFLYDRVVGLSPFSGPVRFAGWDGLVTWYRGEMWTKEWTTCNRFKELMERLDGTAPTSKRLQVDQMTYRRSEDMSLQASRRYVINPNFQPEGEADATFCLRCASQRMAQHAGLTNLPSRPDVVPPPSPTSPPAEPTADVVHPGLRTSHQSWAEHRHSASVTSSRSCDITEWRKCSSGAGSSFQYNQPAEPVATKTPDDSSGCLAYGLSFGSKHFRALWTLISASWASDVSAEEARDRDVFPVYPMAAIIKSSWCRLLAWMHIFGECCKALLMLTERGEPIS